MADEQQLDEIAIKIQVIETDAIKKIKELTSSFKKFKKQSEKSAKSASLFTKALRSIGRVAFYRVIRASIKNIVQSMSEGLSNIRTENKQLDNSLSSISLSITSLKNSIGTLIAPLVNVVAPVLTKISDGIANFSNKLSEAQAALRGEDTYTKILTSDTKEYQEQLNKTNKGLLAFDKFTSLKGEKSYTGVITDSVDMPIEKAQNFIGTLKTIGITIAALVGGVLAYKIGDRIVSLWSKLSDFKKNFKENFSPKALGIVAIGIGIAEIYKGITDTIDAFKNGGTVLQKFAGILKIVAGGLAVVFGILMFTKVSLLAKTIVGLIAGVAVVASLITSAVAASKAQANNIQSFATGGVYEKGDYLKANENGKTELIASTNNGGGAVMNLQQWEKISEVAFYNALNRYGVAQGNGSGGTVVLDGKRVGELVEGSVYREGVRVGHWSRG